MNRSLSNDSRPRSMIDWVAGRWSLIAPPGGFFLASGPTGDDDGTPTSTLSLLSCLFRESSQSNGLVASCIQIQTSHGHTGIQPAPHKGYTTPVCPVPGG